MRKTNLARLAPLALLALTAGCLASEGTDTTAQEIVRADDERVEMVPPTRIRAVPPIGAARVVVPAPERATPAPSEIPAHGVIDVSSAPVRAAQGVPRDRAAGAPSAARADEVVTQGTPNALRR